MKLLVLLIVGVIAISFAVIFIRLAEAPPLVAAVFRLAIASIVIIPFTYKRSVSTLIKIPRFDLVLVLLSGVFIALHFWLWITSLEYTSIASSVVLVTAHPVFVAVLSFVLWGRKLNKLAVLGISIAIVGVLIINSSGFVLGSDTLFGNVLALIAGFAMGSYLIIGHHLRARIDASSYITIVYSVSAIIVVIAAVFSEVSFSGYPGNTYMMLVLLALVPQLIGHSSLNIAVRSLPAIVVSVAILGEPVGATLLGVIMLDEIPGITEISGGILVISGIFLVIRKSYQETIFNASKKQEV